MERNKTHERQAARSTSTDNVAREDLIDASLAALREQLEIDAVSTPELDEEIEIATEIPKARKLYAKADIWR